jgi:pimeloyl-ACP methyl ester carboxylesterase
MKVYESTSKRLAHYKLFSNTTIKLIASFAQKQAQYKNYQNFFKEVGVPKIIVHTTKKGDGVPLIDIPARTKKAAQVLVIHLPMGNPLDANQLYQVATIAATNPTYRVIAFGNPSGKPNYYRQQNLTFLKRFKIAFTKNKHSLVEAELDYLYMQNIEEAHHVGYSYGALKALMESYYSKKNSVKGIILIEPVAHSRGLKQLAEDFQATFKPMGEYVNRTNIPSYFKARVHAEKNGASAAQTLLRPINIAIAILLAHTDFLQLLKNVINQQPRASITVAWGSESELGNDAHLKANLYNLSSSYQIHAMRLEGDKHALANDIYLYAAIVHEALSISTKVE